MCGAVLQEQLGDIKIAFASSENEGRLATIVCVVGCKSHLTPRCNRTLNQEALPLTTLGTPFSPTATRVLLCGSGELGKEVVIELQRLGVEVIACDRYDNAPAMQVAHRAHVINMLDEAALEAVIAEEQPHLVVPEIEATSGLKMGETPKLGGC